MTKLATDLNRVPKNPLCLGLTGLLPFWALAIADVLRWPAGLDPALSGFVLALYAATILSFLGGIRWGIAVTLDSQQPMAGDYILGVTPQLLGWSAMALPDPWRLLALALAILLLGPVDRRLVTRGLAPAWFGRMRLLLSLGAGSALLLAAFA